MVATIMKSAIPQKRNRENKRMVSHGHPMKRHFNLQKKLKMGTLATDPKEVIEALIVYAI